MKFLKKVSSCLVVFFALFMSPSIYACDPLGCLFSGHNQDALILGKVISVSGNTQDIEVEFVFPKNKKRYLEKGRKIQVKLNQPFTYKGKNTVKEGEKYLLSLNKVDDFYVSAWGLYEVKGENYSTMKRVTKTSLDDIALQLFINSGGAETGFSFDYTNQKKPVLTRYDFNTDDNNVKKLEPFKTLICSSVIKGKKQKLTFNKGLKKCQ